jgi:cephalosporin-C deacetylase
MLPLLALCLVPFSVFAASGKVETKPRDVLRAKADHADAVYRTGETVTFIVTLEHDGAPVSSGEIQWTLTKDGVDPKQNGRAEIVQGKARVTGKLDEPGFLQCRATTKAGTETLTALAGAGVRPREIGRSAPAPDDFDAFWAAKKKALAAVPINARLTPAKSGRADVEAFDLQADSVGAPVSAYYARPVGAKPRSLPAILTVHGAGVNSSSLSGTVGWAKDGVLAMDMNAHGLPNGRDKAFYDALAAGELKDYRVRGRESRDTIYFQGMYLRLIRAIDFLTSQPEWDGRTMVVYGSSQGGAQAIAAAGLDQRVSFFMAGVPAMCDHTGALAGRIAGWPKFIPTGEKPSPAVVEAVRYYDGVNFAARAKAPGFFTVGFIDTTCPPSSVYAAFNALTTPKDIFNDIPSGHTNSPAASAASRAAVKRHFEAMRSASK